eukprot:3406776-Alexandrium_andersonii.AAC.1
MHTPGLPRSPLPRQAGARRLGAAACHLLLAQRAAAGRASVQRHGLSSLDRRDDRAQAAWS